MSITGIYMIINSQNGKRYIGSACDIKERWYNHIRTLRLGKHHSIALQRAWDLYQEDSFEFIIVEECEADDLVFIEQKWLDTFPEYNIYKIAGSPKGYKHKEESKIKIGDWSRGKPLSEETKNKMRESQRNRSLSHQINHANSMKKRGITPEHKQKLKEANMKRGYKFKD